MMTIVMNALKIGEMAAEDLEMLSATEEGEMGDVVGVDSEADGVGRKA